MPLPFLTQITIEMAILFISTKFERKKTLIGMAGVVIIRKSRNIFLPMSKKNGKKLIPHRLKKPGSYNNCLPC